MPDVEYVGVGARFGTPLESKEKHANETRLVLADPPDCCSKPKNKVFNLSYILFILKACYLSALLYHMLF